MNKEKFFVEIEENIETVISQNTPLGVSLWGDFIEAHPVDIAGFIGTINRDNAKLLFFKLPTALQFKVFRELFGVMQVYLLSCMNEQERVNILSELPIDELVDLFGNFSDEELKLYYNLLQKNVRHKVLALLQFDPQSAGGIMDCEVVTLPADFTVAKSIELLQRLSPRREIHQQIYIVNSEQQLLGHIDLQDLVLQKPTDQIASFMHKNELVVRADDDQEKVAKQMVHYDLMTVPVVDYQNCFLGVIPSDILVNVIVEEASEDVQKMAAMPPMRYPYFEMSFLRLFCQRGYVLVALLIAESFSGNILRANGGLTVILASFIPMLTSAGGNAGSQASAVVIQGISSGEFGFFNMFRLLRRELFMSSTISVILGIISFIRVFLLQGSTITECLAISSSLATIIFIASMSGTTLPFILRRFNIDPAFFAGPFLATVMDILGVVIFCYLSQFFLG